MKCACHYRVVDGVSVHINGAVKPEDVEVINQLIRVAKNYVAMKKLNEKK